MEIALVRHDKPEQLAKAPITAIEFQGWINAYNASGIAEHSSPPANVLVYANSCSAIISSSLKRSIDSATQLNASKLILSDDVFIEAGLPAASLGTLKLPPQYWAALFRVLWFTGYTGNSESYQDAKKRAAQASKQLIKFAEIHTRILFVGHGIFNRLLVNELKARGWSASQRVGSKYWSMGVMKK